MEPTVIAYWKHQLPCPSLSFVISWLLSMCWPAPRKSGRIFQLYRGGHFYWWRKPDDLWKAPTCRRSRVIDAFSKLSLSVPL
jgi:hypothetical protein